MCSIARSLNVSITVDATIRIWTIEARRCKRRARHGTWPNLAFVNPQSIFRHHRTGSPIEAIINPDRNELHGQAVVTQSRGARRSTGEEGATNACSAEVEIVVFRLHRPV